MFTVKERHPVLLAILALGLTLLTACSSGSDSGSPDAGTASVASLATPTTAGTATAASAKAERPLIRPDTSEAELARMYKAWGKCLRANGLPADEVRMSVAKRGLTAEDGATYEEQCGNKVPEYPGDRARTDDPDYADHLRAEVKCLNDHGIAMRIDKDGGLVVDDAVPATKDHWLSDCEDQAFADYFKTLW